MTRKRQLTALLTAVMFSFCSIAGAAGVFAAETEASSAPESAASASESAAPASESTAPVSESAAPASESAASLSEPAAPAESDTVANEDGSVRTSRIHYAADYEEIFQALRKAHSYYPYYDYGVEVLDGDVEYAAEESVSASSDAMAVGSVPTPLSGGGDWSETNVRTEGVDESDVVKTDGRYLYILQHGTDLAIVRANGAEMEQISRIHITDQSDYASPGGREFFVKDNRLYIITEEAKKRGAEDSDYWYYTTAAATKIITYDISDPAVPVKEGEMEQDGTFRQARMLDGVVYLFTEWRPYVGNSLKDSDIYISAAGRRIEAGRFSIPNLVTDADYLVISALNPDRPSEITDCKALVSGAEQLYVSAGSIYALTVDYSTSKERTEITRFIYQDGAITGKAAGTVRGTVKDTFAIDEYGGNVRVLTTYTGSIRGNFLEMLGDLFGFDYDDEDRWTRHNALFILDGDLRMKGRIIDLAPGEEIRSARYFGDTAYFVTFRNTDPLFTADLSDPAHPVITDELKLPGFSSYLHPFGDGKLLGLGYDADEETGMTTGLKLSVFDLNSGEGVSETDRTVIPNLTWCPALEEYKAIFADADRHLAGFFHEDRFLLYQLKEDGFDRVLLYDYYEDGLQGTASYDTMRAVRIGETLYLAGPASVIAFDMSGSYEKESVLRLQ